MQTNTTISPHGVMDITSAYEAGGSGFDPQWGLLFVVFLLSMIFIVYTSACIIKCCCVYTNHLFVGC
jgi:hypothetical protein